MTIVTALVVAGLVYTMSDSALQSQAAQRVPPAEQVAEARTGRIVVPIDDQFCREYSFNNQNGAFGGERVVRCDAKQSASSPSPLGGGGGGGFEAFKQAFGKKQ